MTSRYVVTCDRCLREMPSAMHVASLVDGYGTHFAHLCIACLEATLCSDAACEQLASMTRTAATS